MSWAGRMKKLQESLKFYHSFFQFNPPYYIIADETFVCSVLAGGKLKNDQIEHYLSQRFNGKCKLFVTPCVATKLENLLDGKLKALKATDVGLRTYAVQHCQQYPTCSARCLTTLATQNQFKKNPGPPQGKRYRHLSIHESRVIVASQDANLLKSMRLLPGAPVIYFHNSSLVMDSPPPISVQWANLCKLRKMESVTIEKEILEHALQEEQERRVGGKRRRVKVDEGIIAEVSEVRENEAGKESKKRSREVSPDICEIGRPADPSLETKTVFAHYRTLLNDESSLMTAGVQTRSRKRQNRDAQKVL